MLEENLRFRREDAHFRISATFRKGFSFRRARAGPIRAYMIPHWISYAFRLDPMHVSISNHKCCRFRVSLAHPFNIFRNSSIGRTIARPALLPRRTDRSHTCRLPGPIGRIGRIRLGFIRFAFRVFQIGVCSIFMHI